MNTSPVATGALEKAIFPEKLSIILVALYPSSIIPENARNATIENNMKISFIKSPCVYIVHRRINNLNTPN